MEKNNENVLDKEELINEENESVDAKEENQAPEKTEEEKLREELSEQKDKHLRLMAEYDNFRKRSAKERMDSFSDATVKIVSDILPIYDNFERALATQTGDETYKKGIEMIFNQFTETLTKLGVEAIDPTGKEFDPNVANAVNQIVDENLGENIVAQTFQKGYKIGERVIRYAMVVVAN